MGLEKRGHKKEMLSKNRNNNFWQGKKVLITGHTGFKGSWLTLWLNELGAEILGYALEPDCDKSLFNQLNLQEKCINKIENILDQKTLEKVILDFSPDVVFHLAAQPLVGFSYKNPSLTWSVNVMGTIHVLEALRKIQKKVIALIITSDKVYKNFEWDYAYREDDKLGGDDPYSGSKAAVEIAVNSWRLSFCGNSSHQSKFLKIATARAGNVIGGGDWIESRIIPDLIDSLVKNKEVLLRNPLSTRPWQHVLEPLSGYLKLAERMYLQNQKYLESGFNFGPNIESNQTVKFLIKKCLIYWDGKFKELKQDNSPHEAGKLNVSIEKSFHKLNWKPTWDFETTVKKTILWYRNFLLDGVDPLSCCLNDLSDFENQKNIN